VFKIKNCPFRSRTGACRARKKFNNIYPECYFKEVYALPTNTLEQNLEKIQAWVKALENCSRLPKKPELLDKIIKAVEREIKETKLKALRLLKEQEVTMK